MPALNQMASSMNMNYPVQSNYNQLASNFDPQFFCSFPPSQGFAPFSDNVGNQNINFPGDISSTVRSNERTNLHICNIQ